MAEKKKIGWIRMGRMGYPMAERLLKAGMTSPFWNRTCSKAEPLAKLEPRLRTTCSQLKDVDVLFSHCLDRKDLDQVDSAATA